MNTSHISQLGHYEILDTIRAEKTYTTYKARRQNSNQLVMLKVLSEAAARDPANIKRFEQEYFVGCSLLHPNIVGILNHSVDGGTHFLVLEYIEGISLDEHIDAHGKLTERQALILTQQLCQALHKIHSSGLIHRNVIPNHLTITREKKVKLTNLGIVKDLMGEDMGLTRTGTHLGTPHFMAPEQFRDAKRVDVRADIYSVGGILYYAVTGKLPFDGCSLFDAWQKKNTNDIIPANELVPELSPEVNELITIAMNADREQRFESSRAFELEIKNVLSGKPVRPLVRKKPQPVIPNNESQEHSSPTHANTNASIQQPQLQQTTQVSSPHPLEAFRNAQEYQQPPQVLSSNLLQISLTFLALAGGLIAGLFLFQSL